MIPEGHTIEDIKKREQIIRDFYREWKEKNQSRSPNQGMRIKSQKQQRFDNTYVFGELDYINNLRNRIAHHEPICFGNPVCIDTSYAKNRYNRIMTLFGWMGIDGASLLYVLGHISNACDQIDKLLQ